MNKENRLGFVHKFIPSKEKQGQGGREKVLTFLLLHGTGENEEDLIPIGREISSEAAILSPRGKVLENGMPRFFRRLSGSIQERLLRKYLRTVSLWSKAVLAVS